VSKLAEKIAHRLSSLSRGAKQKLINDNTKTSNTEMQPSSSRPLSMLDLLKNTVSGKQEMIQ
jgi:hypothetical protein